MGDEPGTVAVAATDTDADGPPPKPWWRRELRYLIEITAVAGFAVAQPLLGSFGESPETFVTTGASRFSIVVFAVALVVVPALLVWSVAALSSLGGPRTRQSVQGIAVGLFVTLLMQWALQGVLSGVAVTVAAVAAGALSAVAYPRLAAIRLYLAFASIAPIAFLAMFIGFSSVTPLLFSPDPVDATASSKKNQASVVVLVLDELPTASLLDGEDQIDAALFPNFARLAEDSNFYRNNTTVATHTDTALPAIVTGRYPVEIKAGRRDYSENLFNLLTASHDLNVKEAITALCTDSQCERPTERRALKHLGVRAWQLWSDVLEGRAERMESTGPVVEKTFDMRYERTDRFIDSIEAEGGRPRLDFGHLLIPHQQWERLPDGHHYTSEAPYPSQFGGEFSSGTGARLARQRHLLQLQFADRVVGRLLDRLEELDRYDGSYVLVTADHGVAFQKGEQNRGGTLTDTTIPEIMWTPLFVKKPDQVTGSVSDENTQTIDVFPTIADATGIDIPWKVDGRSLLDGKPIPKADKRFLPYIRSIAAKEGAQAIDGVKGYEQMLALPPAADVPSSDPLALYRLAPYTDLTGTRVEDLPKGPPVDLAMRLDDPGRYEAVDLNARFLPVYISSDIDAASNPEGRVVVSVNGVIGGWGGHEIDWAHGDWRTEARFAVMVPPSLLRSGRNVIEVYALSGEPGSVTLHEVNLG